MQHTVMESMACCMSGLVDIYHVRKALDPGRQRRHDAAYSHLVDLFAAYSVQQPYVKEDEPRALASWKQIFEDLPFLTTCEGSVANINAHANGSKYFYRVTNWDYLLSKGCRGLKYKKPQRIDWSTILSRQAVQDWTDLDVYFDGLLTGPRGATWWTPEDLSADPYRVGHRSGLVDAWIGPRTVILRCPLKMVAEAAKVPSIVDGFCDPIFCSTQEVEHPTIGHCINLEKRPLALDGGKEIVCVPIPAASLQFRAVPETAIAAENKVNLAEILPDLLAFYLQMKEAKAT